MQRISRLKERERDMIAKSFCNDLTAQQASEMVGISRNTANKWYAAFRGLIAESIKAAPRFKGTIELDQAFFGRKRRKSRKKKVIKRGLNYGLSSDRYKKEKISKKDDLIQTVGFLLRKPKKKSVVYTHIIRNVKRDTIMPVVHLIVDGASRIYTDSHSSLSDLSLSGYKHQKVNHSRKQFSLGAGVHTNNLESFWGFSKTRLEKFRGIARQTLPLHIKECEWRWNNKGNLSAALKKLITPA